MKKIIIIICLLSLISYKPKSTCDDCYIKGYKKGIEEGVKMGVDETIKAFKEKLKNK